MTLHHVFENIPNNWFTTVDNLLGTLDRLHDSTLDEFTNDERFIEFGSHQFRQTALAHFQFGTDHNDGTCGIVDTFTQEILTETAGLTFQRVR